MPKRVFTQIVLSGICLFSLYLCTSGLDRSLWLDESWVANSLLTPTLQQCLFYDAWLQTSPPLFLLLGRIPIALFGASNVTLRMIPFLMTAIAAVFSGLLFKRHLSRPYLLCAFLLLFCSPPVVYRAQDLKQYSTEMAASAVLLYLLSRYRECPTKQRFFVLLLVSALLIWLANALAFVIPGIAVAIALSTPASTKERIYRPIVYGASTGLSLTALYFFFTRPNWVPPLAQFFHWMAGRVTLKGQLADSATVLFKALAFPAEAAVPAVVATFTFLWALLPALVHLKRRRPLKDSAVYIACVSPCLLLIVAKIFGLYPMVERVLAFVLPGLVLQLVCSLETISNGLARRLRRPVAYGFLALSFVSVGLSYRHRGFDSFSVPIEDNQAATAYLIESVRESDTIYVHASLKEPFKLYSRLGGAPDMAVRYGNSAPPCCARNTPFSAGKASAGEALADFEQTVGAALPSRLWLLFTLRQDHWDFAGLDEGQFLYAHLRKRGCVSFPTPRFRGVVLIHMLCP